MSRPRKNNADYFSHDKGMRNDAKIQALRNNFGNEGYAIWCFFLETLTDKENFKIKIHTEQEWEIIAGDFRISAELAKNIIGFCSRNDLLQSKNGIFWCNNLIKRLEPMTQKREFLRQKYASRVVSTTEMPVSTTEMPQSKVKESKVYITPNGDKSNSMYKEQTIELDENGDEIEVHTSKSTFGRHTASVAKFYCELMGKTSASRQLVASKELFILAQSEYPTETIEQWEKEIKDRIKVASKWYRLNNVKDWNLSKVAENWDKILNNWSSKLK